MDWRFHGGSIERRREPGAAGTIRGALAAPLPPSLVRAVERLNVGDAEASLIAASEACRRADPPAAHYAYGQAWAALGQHARAEQAFAEAVRLAPRWADAWVNYGVARYRQGAIEDAKTAMRRRSPSIPATPPRRPISARSCASPARRRRPRRCCAHAVAASRTTRRAAQSRRRPLAGGARRRGARAARRGRARRRPGAAPALAAAAALALLQLGRAGEARATLEPRGARRGAAGARAAVALAPRAARARRGRRRARARRSRGSWRRRSTHGAGGGARARDHGALRSRQVLVGPERARARAFAQWTAGHALLRAFQPFSRDEHRAFVDARSRRFDAARLRAGPRAANADPAPVFIVGMPRSGTTLMRADPGRPSRGPRRRRARGAGAARSRARRRRTTRGGRAHRRARRRRRSTPRRSAIWPSCMRWRPARRRIVDKMPGNFLYLGLVGAAAAGRADHLLRARSARHRPVDLHLPFPRRITATRTISAISAGTSASTTADGALAGGAAEPDPDGAADGLGRRISTRRWRACSPISTCRRSGCERFHERESRVRTVSRSQVRQPINARGIGRWRDFADRARAADRASSKPRAR